MFEEYMKIADKDEQRKAFALDCVIRLEEGRGTKRLITLDERFVKQCVERAKAFETYLLGKE